MSSRPAAGPRVYTTGACLQQFSQNQHAYRTARGGVRVSLNAGEESQRLYPRYVEFVTDALEEVGAGARPPVLDVGCGAALSTVLFQKCGCSAVWTDLGTSDIHEHVPFVASTAGSLPFVGGT